MGKKQLIMKNTFKVIRNETTSEMSDLIGRSDWKKPQLNPPHFPDASEREVHFGVLGRLLKRLTKKS